MMDQQLEDNKLPVCEWLRKHYIQPETEYMAICRHCSSKIFYKHSFIYLLDHLTKEHSEVLTEEQKRDKNVHWAWDYFTPKANKKAQCNICSRLMNYKKLQNLEIHLHIHRRQFGFFNPRSDNASSSGIGCTTVQDVEHPEVSILIVSNRIDNTDRSGISNEYKYRSTTKTSEPIEHVMDIPENAEGIENVEKDLSAELELRDTEEVPGREKFSTRGKLPVRDDLHVREELLSREELTEVVKLQLLPGQSEYFI